MGDGRWGRGLFERGDKLNKYGALVFRSFINEIKSKIFSQLSDNLCHFPTKSVINEKFFDQLFSEHLVVKRVNGVKVVKYDLIHDSRRNEVLDCFTYSTTAYNIIRPVVDNAPDPEKFKSNQQNGLQMETHYQQDLSQAISQ